MPTDMNLMIRSALCQEHITLDGHPAVIRGARLDFATIARLDGQGQAEWSWDTVQRIVDKGGDFRS